MEVLSVANKNLIWRSSKFMNAPCQLSVWNGLTNVIKMMPLEHRKHYIIRAQKDEVNIKHDNNQIPILGTKW